jgi:hypothetical protein
MQALQDDLELLVLGPAPSPACVHHLKPFDLGTAPITVHKDSSQHHASFGKAAFTGRIRQKGKRPDELKTLDAPPGDEESSMTASKFWEAWIAFVFEAG